MRADSLYDLIRPRQQRRRDRQAEGLGGLEVDDQLEFRRLLDGKLGELSLITLHHLSRTVVQISC